MAMLGGGAGLGEARAHRGRRRRIVARCAIEDFAHAVEPLHLIVGRQQRVVGDIVGVAGEAVESVDMDPQILADQKRPDREILVAPAFARRGFERVVCGGRLGGQHCHVKYPLASNQATASTIASRAGRGA